MKIQQMFGELSTTTILLFAAIRGGWQRGLEPSYMIAPVKKFGRVRLSTNFPSKHIWRRQQKWKEDEFLLSLSFPASKH